MPPEPIKTSFIPKASLKVEHRREATHAPIALASLIATILLVLAVAGAAGVFLYQQYLISSIASKKDSLERARAAFQPETIRELARVDTRLEVGTELLNAHLSPSLLLDEIAARTLTSVRFGGFQFTHGAGGKYMLSMSGVAKSFNAVALESDEFGKSEMWTNPIFSNINFDQTGNVAFDVTAEVIPARILYRGATASATPATGTHTTTP